MEEKKVQLIALDLDHTTLDNTGKISEENKNALIAAIEKGIHVVIASGRPFTALPKDVVSIPGIEYAITGNGCTVNRVPGGERLREVFLSCEAIDGILDQTKYDQVYYECFIEGQAYADAEFLQDPANHGSTGRAVSYLQSTRIPVKDMKEFIRKNAGKIDAIDLVTMNVPDMTRIWQHLEHTIPGIFVTSSVQQLIEISSWESSKSKGVQFLLDYLGIQKEHAAAFGDGDNDADMLALVGYGFAMENGTENCKKAASYMTRSNDECGVAYALKEILKII